MHIKTLIFLSLILTLGACTPLPLNKEEAIKLTDSFMNDLQKENYQNADSYFSSSFNNSEPLDEKIKKYNKLREVMGVMESFELLSAAEEYDKERGVNQIKIIYKAKCARVTAMETFLVVKDEGDLKIVFQNIENL